MEFAHFIAAQEGIYARVLSELRRGQKTSHWMWFIFPQLRGLGFSPTAQRFALDSLDEAQRYLQHPLLGARLVECTRLVLAVTGRSAWDIFHTPDDLKFRSSMTLFALADAKASVFQEALDQYFEGQPDTRTLQLLGMTGA